MIASLLKRLTKTGFQRGWGGSNAWLVVGIVAGGARVLRHLAKSNEEVVYRTVLQAGETIEVVTKKTQK